MYDKNSIESLSPLQFTRLRPGVYCGDTTYPNHLIVELVSNAVDEHNLGHGDKIYIHVYKDNQNLFISVADEGQGFPIGEEREDGRTVLEAAFSVMNTSAKYRDDGVYEGTSLGLNGIGAKLPIYLSHYARVESWQNGKIERDLYSEGCLSNIEIYDLHNISDEYASSSGTRIVFQPSEEFFIHIEPDKKALESFLDDITILCPQLTIELKWDSETKIFSHPKGLEDFLNKEIKKTVPLTSELIFQEQSEKRKLDAALVYTSNNSSKIVAYVNYGLTDAGPHLTAAKSCITRSLNKWAKEQGLLKEKDKNLEGSNLQEGLVLIFNLVSPGIAYDAQVKSRIVSNEFVSFLNEAIGKNLELWLDNNPADGRAIIDKALVARKAAEAAKRARENVRKKASGTTGVIKQKNINLPSKLSDCYSTDRSKCELIITEGDSASGNLKAVRDKEFQAVLGVKGKVLNTQKATLDKAMANAEIMDLIKALGFQPAKGDKKLAYDKNKVRYGKVIIMSDAK